MQGCRPLGIFTDTNEDGVRNNGKPVNTNASIRMR